MEVLVRNLRVPAFTADLDYTTILDFTALLDFMGIRDVKAVRDITSDDGFTLDDDFAVILDIKSRPPSVDITVVVNSTAVRDVFQLSSTLRASPSSCRCSTSSEQSATSRPPSSTTASGRLRLRGRPRRNHARLRLQSPRPSSISHLTITTSHSSVDIVFAHSLTVVQVKFSSRAEKKIASCDFVRPVSPGMDRGSPRSQAISSTSTAI